MYVCMYVRMYSSYSFEVEVLALAFQHDLIGILDSQIQSGAQPSKLPHIIHTQ